ncbi:MAG: DUF1552 domain-containing protein [bacterium]|nr:DUF1552 domain-containing protein [bacterium]
MKSHRPISRRTMLRGTGATLALPWLEAMSTDSARAAATTSRPTRFAALYVPNGVREDTWTPSGSGRDFELGPAMKSLEDLREELLIPTNLWNQASKHGDGHYVKTSGWLTCTTITKSIGIDVSCNGVSVDQIAARSVAGQTPLPSMELAIDPVSTGVDTNVGYTRVYGSHIAWAGPTKPLARETNPRLAFERLFRLTQPHSGQAARDVLLLDRVLEDAMRFQTRLGVADRQRMEEYLDSVRSLESRVQRATQDRDAWQPLTSVDPKQKPAAGIPESHQEHVRLMMDILALAFQTDATRVCTFMFGNSVSGKSFSFLDGVQGGHHDISHHQNDPEKLRQYQIITEWHVEQYGYLLRKLRAMQEGESNVLESSIILLGNELRDGNSHSPHNLPLIVGGRANGRLAAGQHLEYERDTPLANLYVSLLNAFGTSTDQFGDSTGGLKGVLQG